MGKPVQIKSLNAEPVIPLNDESLWKEFLKGDSLAYEDLYNKYVKELYQYAYMIVRNKPLTEDVIHDVFTSLWSSRKSVGKIRSVRLYLFSSVKRGALRKLKKERSFTCFNQDVEELAFEIVSSFEDELIDAQQKELVEKKIKACVSGLSNRQREIIYLRFYQEMTYSEIAELLQLDQKYTYNLASKAFILLRKSIPRFALLIIFFMRGF
jgi:RNA polymerase sigma factor (sigma-70 family)